MYRLIIKYAIFLFVILSLLKFIEFQFFSYKMPLGLYLGIIATLFLIAGFFISYVIFFKNKKTTSASHEITINQDKLAEFSPREQQVLNLLCHGYTNKEIASCLNISTNTVKTHLSKLFGKLGVNNRTQALSEARLLNIIG
ncbi:MAG: response regulator transcription factor [Methylococcales bacterium]